MSLPTSRTFFHLTWIDLINLVKRCCETRIKKVETIVFQFITALRLRARRRGDAIFFFINRNISVPSGTYTFASVIALLFT